MHLLEANTLPGLLHDGNSGLSVEPEIPMLCKLKTSKNYKKARQVRHSCSFYL
jgi:hypothetical protein